jgi:predicted nucleic acid-binding protein
MRVLLDTNVLIHREAAVVVHQSIGPLFNWLDKLHCEKCVHSGSQTEIAKHQDPKVRSAFAAKLVSYNVLKTLAPVGPEIQAILDRDPKDNSRVDTLLLNEVFCHRVDFLITEDRGLARKAEGLGIGDRVFTIEAFLEKVNAENPALADYKVLSVRKLFFGQVPVNQAFFDSFRADYGGHAFAAWFNKKSDEPAYCCFDENRLVAFLYLKIEGPDEHYSDIQPALAPARRLKIGTFKVELNGYKLGERFLKIVFDNALRQRADEIYVTIFDRTVEQQRLISLLEEFGFVRHGVKKNQYGDEWVYVRRFQPASDLADPKLTFPYVSRQSRVFLVPIYPQYHTDLLPDSILKTEEAADFEDPEPHRNAIKKVYVSRSYFRDLQRGDVIVFYRTGGYHKAVVTTVGIVEGIYRNIQDEDQFVRLCRKRSVFTDDELRAQWRYKPHDKPFIVGFLYCYAFPKRPTMKDLIDNGVIKDVNSAPRGFEQISADQFGSILKLAKADTRLVVD